MFLSFKIKYQLHINLNCLHQVDVQVIIRLPLTVVVIIDSCIDYLIIIPVK